MWAVWLGMLGLGCVPQSADRDLVSQLEREVRAARMRNGLLRDELATCGEAGPPAEVYAKLVQVFKGTEVTVSRHGTRSMVTIPAALLFPRGSTRVRREANMILDLVALSINLHSEMHAWVVGHTDDRAVPSRVRRSYPTNWEYSAARAAAFVRILIKKYQVDPAQLTVAGRGGTQPVSENDTPAGRQQNQRIVIEIGLREKRDPNQN